MTGTLIVLEGIDGGGKTSQAHTLVDELNQSGIRARYVRAPGETPIGKAIRGIVLDQDPPLYTDLYTRQLLFLADHNELLYQVIVPALHAGEVVVCDRFLDSTFAYAVGGLKLDVDRIRQMIYGVVMAVPPDLVPVVPGQVLLLDIPVNMARARLSQREKVNAWDVMGDEYYTRIANMYYQLYPLNTHANCYIDASASYERVTVSIAHKVAAHLGTLGILPVAEARAS